MGSAISDRSTVLRVQVGPGETRTLIGDHDAKCYIWKAEGKIPAETPVRVQKGVFNKTDKPDFVVTHPGEDDMWQLYDDKEDDRVGFARNEGFVPMPPIQIPPGVTPHKLLSEVLYTGLKDFTHISLHWFSSKLPELKGFAFGFDQESIGVYRIESHESHPYTFSYLIWVLRLQGGSTLCLTPAMLRPQEERKQVARAQETVQTMKADLKEEDFALAKSLLQNPRIALLFNLTPDSYKLPWIQGRRTHSICANGPQGLQGLQGPKGEIGQGK